uniref:Transcription factor HES-5 n=1 Tax=Neogobius melanostomus TaxID=47308 RepID=A0A8C6SIH0_9GOBI
MAPTITEAMGSSLEHLSLSHKLRKPVVEKLRRERINSSIEQLKSLLCAEFLHQQPDSKLEKADILEMTVSFLTRLHKLQYEAVGQGYSRCSQQMMQFMSKEQLLSSSQKRVLLTSTESNPAETRTTIHSGCSKDKSQESITLWRPW